MDTQNPKIPFYMQRPFGEKMNASFDFIKENWKVLFKYMTYLLLPVSLVQALSINSFMDQYLGAMMANSNSDLDIDNLGASFFVSYGSLLFFSVIGSLLMTSLLYALIRIYNERQGGLVGITYSEFKGRMFKNMGRLLLLGVVAFFLIILVSIVLGLLTALTPFTLFITLPALIAVAIALTLWPSVYLFEDIGVGASLTKAFRLGFATWGGIFVVILVMGTITNVFQGVAMTPWYLTTVVKALFAESGNTAYQEPSLLYSFFVYILAVVFVFGTYLSAVFGIIGLSYQYSHASEKLDSVTVESEIDNFENL